LKYVVGETRCRLYDWRHNVQTCGDVSVASLGDVGNNVDHAAPYMPSHPKFLDSIIRNLDIDYGKYQFVDLGSGKGRVILVASEFPFARVQGVEFSRSLHDIAVRNVQRYNSRSQRCKNVEPIHGDAIEYQFPRTPLVIFMFNPFRPAVLVPVLHNLEASINKLPRDVVLFYTAPFYGDLVES
jgi:SAM-dependent methyltransferase